MKRRGPATVLAELGQDGCLKARFPRVEAGEPALAVTLNIAGGVAGGDSHRLRIEAGAGTALTVAGQAAERIYRALPGQVARIETALSAGAGALLEWLPQETILFDRCALDRTLAVGLAEGAAFTGVESLVFGRAAMGETVREVRLLDRMVLRRGGRLLLHDATRLDGPAAAVLGRAASAAGARAMATLLHVGPEAAALLDPLRAALAEAGTGSGAEARIEASIEAGASLVEGVLLLARIVAADGAALRRAVAAGLSVLRGGRALPRTWHC